MDSPVWRQLYRYRSSYQWQALSSRTVRELALRQRYKSLPWKCLAPRPIKQLETETREEGLQLSYQLGINIWPFPTDMRNLWTRGPNGKSVRNEARWAALELERLKEAQAAQDWFYAALADEWTAKATYPNEPTAQAFSLEKEGFHVQGLARPSTAKMLGGGSIYVWGPDKLALRCPIIYSSEFLIKELKTCSNCNNYPVETFCYSFAGRCCKQCLPEMKRLHEKPGWCD